MLALYRLLLQLYPAGYRHEYEDEMIAVFQEARACTEANEPFVRAAFCFREIYGLLRGALHERVRFSADSTPFAARRFTMRSEFRFPKSTMLLMLIILGGVILAIEKAKSIAASLPHTNPLLPPIHPLPPTFAQAVGLMFAVVYAGAIVGWVVLFALRRSGLHRLEDMDTSASQK
jgi:hypothetical protein